MKDTNPSPQENSSLLKKEDSWFKNTRFWVILYLSIQTIGYSFYSFPILNHFQQIYSSIFIAGIFVLAIFIKKEYLLYVAILAIIFIDPLYIFSTLSLKFRYQILAGLAVAIILFVKRKELNFILKILLAANIALFLFQQYEIAGVDKRFIQRSHLTGEKNRLYMQVDSTTKAGNNVYVILLDGYPSFEILRDSFEYHSPLQDHLLKNNFKLEQPFTKYFWTPISFLHIFGGREITGDYPEYLLTNRKFFTNALHTSSLVHNLDSNKYKFEFNSFLTDNVGENDNVFNPSPYWPQYSINTITYLIYRYIVLGRRTKDLPPLFVSYHEKINADLKKALKDNSKKMAVFHYITFHNLKQTMIEETQYADQLGVDAINEIISADPKATIIVMSDHGERRHLLDEKNFRFGLYAIRKGY